MVENSEEDSEGNGSGLPGSRRSRLWRRRLCARLCICYAIVPPVARLAWYPVLRST
ncbi:hypothetical protein FIBSPDRAFT_875368 [Athelia psychrophila]|uniref:Uncharacterized protein n=1 Tax=Athelia psychrophila TaxID=1759441 RepID=A0A167XSZ8_9AGAM|nr:hypothetical protein FIBSPDRAFT_875368 [Fibularhizoctonia sp. CBS 109695]